uniref:Sulfatase N-terminal domain-containing protein n=1 Tax=uncultured delta proteobacterium DeepAnt-1F12 TaxID=357894 RepID=Q2I6N5_9DELT|nr:conserved protein of unknown function DUF229 [uncultured delta proteobacterium DeepAnt-1F12]
MNYRPPNLLGASVSVLLTGSLLHLITRAVSYFLLGDAEKLGLIGEAYLWAVHVAVATCVYLLWFFASVVARKRLLVFLLVYFLVAFCAAWPVGTSLGSGGWVSTQWFAPVIRWAPSVSLGMVAMVAGGLLWRFPGAPLWTSLLLIGGVGLLVAHKKIAPGLYPLAHLAVYLTAAGLLFHGILSLLSRWIERRSPLLTSFLSLALVAISFGGYRIPSNLRIGFENEAPTIEYLLGLIQGRQAIKNLSSLLDDNDPGTKGNGKRDPKQPVEQLSVKPIDNVVLIVIDALRTDALPPNRIRSRSFAKKGDTPFLDGLIARSYQFRRAYSQSSQTRISVPAMFRSLEPYDNPRKSGVSLASEMKSLGRRAVAVVPQYFVISEMHRTRALVDDFDQVLVVDKQAQENLVGLVKQAVSQAKGKPFFAWIHPYSMHAPYYAGRPTTKADGSAVKRYRLALRWLDSEMKRLFAVFEEHGLMDRTAFIVTADHGEWLSNRRTGHGAGVSEIETRVPLFALIPGLPGGRRKPVVGNIDIVPTIVDLLGGTIRSRHQGKSLIPLILDPKTPWNRTYYLRNGNERLNGLVQGDQKLVYHDKTGVFKRFNVGKDKYQRKNLYTGSQSKDRELVKLMLRRNPAVMAADLKQDSALRANLVRQFKTVDGAAVNDRLRYLLRVARVVPTKKILDAAEALFWRAPAVEVKLTIFEMLFSTEEARWRRALSKLARSLKTIEERQTLVTRLSQRTIHEFATPWFREQLKALAKPEEITRWQPWLKVIQPWTKGKRWLPVFQALIRTVKESEPSVETLSLLLTNIGALRHRGRGLKDFVASMFNHGDSLVERAATTAWVRLKPKKGAVLLRRKLSEPNLDLRLQKSLLRGLMVLERTRSIRTLTKAGQDPLLTIHVIRLLIRLRSPKALPFLRGVTVKKNGVYADIRARRAIKWIKKKKKMRKRRK